MAAIRVVLVDDHRVVMEGLQAMLDEQEDLEVVGMARNGRDVLELVPECSPDVVVMEVTLPDLNGVEATTRLLAEHPALRVVALSNRTGKRHVRAMLEAGAHAYVSKAAPGAELLRAIQEVCRGRQFLSSDVTGTVVEGFVQGAAEDDSARTLLSSREREVLQLIAEGRTSAEIAGHLHITTHTVDTHRRNLMRKLDLHSVAELTKYAVREGLTGLEQ